MPVPPSSLHGSREWEGDCCHRANVAFSVVWQRKKRSPVFAAQAGRDGDGRGICPTMAQGPVRKRAERGRGRANARDQLHSSMARARSRRNQVNELETAACWSRHNLMMKARSSLDERRWPAAVVEATERGLGGIFGKAPWRACLPLSGYVWKSPGSVKRLSYMGQYKILAALEVRYLLVYTLPLFRKKACQATP